MIFRIILVLCLFSCWKPVFGQNSLRVDYDSISEVRYIIYSPPFKAKKIFKDTVEAKNNSPEQLMSSIMSATNQAWVNYNTKGGALMADQKDETYFNSVIHSDTSATYSELLSKLEFTYYDRQIAVVKFHLYLEGNNEPLAGSTIMEKVDINSWKVISEPSLTPISMALMIFKKDVIYNLLYNKPENDIEIRVLEDVYTKLGLNFNKLLQYKYTKEDKIHLTNPLNW